jgi:hypothetical protein
VHTFDKWCRMADRYARRVVMEPARRYIGTAAAAEVSFSQRFSCRLSLQAQFDCYCTTEIRHSVSLRHCNCNMCSRTMVCKHLASHCAVGACSAAL